jgi:hypothetical protein
MLALDGSLRLVLCLSCTLPPEIRSVVPIGYYMCISIKHFDSYSTSNKHLNLKLIFVILHYITVGLLNTVKYIK